ncbi:hypothetical protein SAMN05216371_7653 [Streptomyces sp. TLI_053]|uniref:hypothetical protein n=1 Tax=Streptomyces sp. TLI_053 TaxID=1855352 RepID=UPI00087A2ED9|nr:hypothetical protein [Streptomyces sp. TLI_053]SDT82846.1 hypothetical protein SAMN05216371_7653 [Streptomyces sp. TLI_053]
MTEPEQPAREPRDPPVRTETPGSRMTGEGGPPPEHDQDENPADGADHASGGRDGPDGEEDRDVSPEADAPPD